MSDSTEISRTVVKKQIPAMNSSNDVYTNSTNFFDNRYYIVNKRVLCLCGQWPYQSDLEKRLKLLFACLLSISLMVPQARAMVFAWGQLDKFVESYSTLGTHVVCLIKLFNTVLHQRTLRNLFDKIHHDWESMRNLTQVDIMKEHGEKGRYWSILWLMAVYFAIWAWLIMGITPKILNVLHPLNYSRPAFDVMPVDYGIDPVKYWWPIQVHMSLCVIILLLVSPAFDTLYMILAQHACAMFEVLRYNLDNILEKDKKIDVVLKPDYHADRYYRSIVSCIEKHRYLVKYIKDIESTYTLCMFILLGFNMTGLSVTGYQVVAKGTPLGHIIRYTLFTVGILAHLFIVTLPGHWIMGASVLFPDSAYSCRWYMMSLRSRKLIILLIRASIEPCTITAGKIYVMSFQNFCGVLQTSMSYLTMLTSMQ